jgi:hypothetical protein
MEVEGEVVQMMESIFVPVVVPMMVEGEVQRLASLMVNLVVERSQE